jgi:hypothetical protein
LRHAHEDGFTATEVEQVWARLEGTTGAGGSRHQSDPGRGSLSGSGSSAAVKAMVVVALAGSVAAASLAMHGFSRSPSPRGLAPVAQVVDPAVPAEPSAAVVEPAPEPAAQPMAPPSDVTARPVDPPRPPSVKALRPAAAKAVTTNTDATGADKVTPSASTPAATASTSAPAVLAPSEGALLLRAHRELASNPEGALELTQQHSRMYPNGALAPEREVLAIEALVGLGRIQEAKSRADALRRAFPGSPHLGHVDALLKGAE